MTSAEIHGVEMVGHDRAFVRRDKVAMSDADQGEMKTPAARAAMSASLQASLGLATSPYEREAQLQRARSRSVSREKKFWPFLGPTIQTTL